MKLSGACTACEGHSRAAQRTYENQGPERQAPAIRAKAATATTRSSAELTVFTAEGDKVTLSASYSAEAGRFSYGVRGGENGRQRGDLRYAAEQASVNVSVEGDLSADEIEDIQRLAQLLTSSNPSGRGGIGTVNGEQDEAQRQAQKSSLLDSPELDTLQSFEYSYSSTVEYSYASLRQRAKSPYQRDMPVYTPPAELSRQEPQASRVEAAA